MFLTFLYEGGPIFMYPLLFFLTLIMILIVRGLLKKGKTKKTIDLINSIAIFAVGWGFLGQIIGLISAFEAIEKMGDVSPAMLAGGLKISFLAPAFGMVIFLIGRLGMILLTWIEKD